MRIKITILFILLTYTGAWAKDYKAAEYRTKESFLYGRFEVRYKPPQKDGVLASFFTYHDGPGGETWNEIDIEILGRHDRLVQFNTITPFQTNHVRQHYVNFNPLMDYHTYAFEWTPEYVAWFIDGEEVYRQTGEHIQTLTRAQKIMMNIWNPAFTNWVGYWSDAVLPVFAYYDWVSYYSYTPGSGNYGSGNNFTHSWTDEFDSWDTERWDKATHTFGGNNSDFIHDNAVFKDGKLILCLTDPSNTGYKDINPPAAIYARSYKTNAEVMFSEQIDEAGAETIGNYIIPGITIKSAELQNDNRTVHLSTSEMDSSKLYNLLYQNISDRFVPSNKSQLKAVTMIKNNPLKTPIKINCGKNSVSGYWNDQEFKYSTEFGYIDGTAVEIDETQDIKNTEMDAVYRSERNNLAGYKVRVPEGVYKVGLMFAENFYDAAGKRVFDILVEDTTHRRNDIDIFASVGKNAAYDELFEEVFVSDGILDIYFEAETGYPILSGLIIEQLTTGAEETGVGEIKFELMQNYPNPFNGGTQIKYSVPKQSEVNFKVYDILGRKIFEEELGFKEKGEHRYRLENSILKTAGVYFYSISSSEYNAVKKMVYLK